MTGEPAPLTGREALLHRLLSLQPALRHRFRATIPAELRLHLQKAMEDVTASQMEVLMLLHQSPSGLSMHELAEAQAITPSSATQLVDRLVRMGLVERLREEDDRRLVRVELSASARQKFEEMLHLHLRSLAVVTEPLGDAELRTLIDLLARVAQPAGGECAR
jgi:DNA-binding MarR family transcriptional regulator